MNKKIYDFSGKKKIWFGLSLALIALIIAFSVIRGVEVAIEFKGGTIITYSYEGDVKSSDVQSDIEALLETPVTIQQGENLSGDSKLSRFPSAMTRDLAPKSKIPLLRLCRKNILTATLKYWIQMM